MKKLFLATTLSLLNLTAYAAGGNSSPLTPSDVAVSYIEGRVTDVHPLCPSEPDGSQACFVNGTVVTVVFGLNGCADRLGPVVWKADQLANGKIHLTVSAINIHNEESNTLMCFVQPTEIVTISLINKFGTVEAEFLTGL